MAPPNSYALGISASPVVANHVGSPSPTFCAFSARAQDSESFYFKLLYIIDVYYYYYYYYYAES